MEYDWLEASKNCVYRLSKDFLNIKRSYIDKGNYAEARSNWCTSLLASHYDFLKSSIWEYYPDGRIFMARVDFLSESLERGNDHYIKMSSDVLLTYIRQVEMRDKIVAVHGEAEDRGWQGFYLM